VCVIPNSVVRSDWAPVPGHSLLQRHRYFAFSRAICWIVRSVSVEPQVIGS
jgi:hypothetical protein